MKQARFQELFRIVGSFSAALALAACSATPQSLATPEEQVTSQAAGTYQARITSSTDDAEQNVSTTNTTSAALEIVQNGSGTPQIIGLRFINVTIPQGATITGTTLRFVAETNTAETTTLTVQGQAIDNAPTFASVANNISTRARTSASTSWTPKPWAEGEDYSLSVSSSVQEIVNRQGWRSGNALAFTISGTGLRRATSFDGDAEKAPQLVVTYETKTTLNPEIELWQQRLEYAFTHSADGQDPAKIAARASDLYILARGINVKFAALTAAYRVNRDPDTVRYMKEFLDVAYSQLKDTNGDGYRNWLWYSGQNNSVSACKDYAEAPYYCGTDRHEMDEMMAHTMIAASAYTLKQAGYTADAAKWVKYLKSDFEPKWRKRNNKPNGMPFIEKDLFHPYTQFIRYNYYMYKLTGEAAYYDEAKRLAKNAHTHIIETADGGVTWWHRIKEGQKSGSTTDCPNTTYIAMVVQAFQDLSVMDSTLFDDAFMRRVAYSTREKVLNDKGDPNRDGGVVYSICGIKPYSSGHPLGNNPYAAPAPWDSTGKIEAKQRRAYDTLKSQSRYSVNAPAMMILSLGLKK